MTECDNDKAECPYDIVYGLEVECLACPSIPIGRYHDGVKIHSFWNSQSDSSLRTDSDDYGCYEFVNNYPLLKEEVGPALRALKTMLDKYWNGQLRVQSSYEDLKSVMFNESTGAHIHFGLVKKGSRERSSGKEYLYRFFNHKLQEEVRKEYTERLAERLPYWDWKKHYYRRQAQPMHVDPNKHYEPAGLMSAEMDSKYWEFHTTLGKGMEWRSVHNVGLKSWTDVELNYACAIEALDTVLKRELSKPKPFLREYVLFEEVEDD